MTLKLFIAAEELSPKSDGRFSFHLPCGMLITAQSVVINIPHRQIMVYSWIYHAYFRNFCHIHKDEINPFCIIEELITRDIKQAKK